MKKIRDNVDSARYHNSNINNTCWGNNTHKILNYGGSVFRSANNSTVPFPYADGGIYFTIWSGMYNNVPSSSRANIMKIEEKIKEWKKVMQIK